MTFLFLTGIATNMPNEKSFYSLLPDYVDDEIESLSTKIKELATKIDLPSLRISPASGMTMQFVVPAKLATVVKRMRSDQNSLPENQTIAYRQWDFAIDAYCTLLRRYMRLRAAENDYKTQQEWNDPS